MRSRSLIAALTVLLGSAGSVCADNGFRDPTRPYVAPESANVARPRFEVNAIFSSDERGVAIVNGKRVTVGSQVHGATVVAIRKDIVSLEVDGEEVTLTVHGEASRQ